MRYSLLKQWALVSLPLICTLGAIWFSFGSEREVAEFFKAHATAHPALSATLKIVTDWSNPVFYAFYAIMLLAAWKSGNHEKRRFVLILLAVQVVISILTVHFIKYTIGRPRPGQGWYFDPLTTRGNYHSFPSGHTTEILGWTLPLALRHNKALLSALLGLLIGVVGFSRLYLGWHHPSDVFFGWLLGSFGGFATHIIVGSSLFRKRVA